jgi:ubiquitin-like domain-containing CTD phosphatase 1
MATDEIKLRDMDLKPNFKIMMMGSKESDIEEACTKPEDIGQVINDLDDVGEDEIPMENREV